MLSKKKSKFENPTKICLVSMGRQAIMTYEAMSNGCWAKMGLLAG